MNSKLLVAGGTIAGLAVGGVGGYFIAKKRLEQAFAEALKEAVDEEVAAVEQHFRILNKRGEYASPEEVLARRTPAVPEGVDYDTPVEGEPSLKILEQTLDGLKYGKYFNSTDQGVITNTPLPNIMGQPEQEMLKPRARPGDPYPIQEEAFFQGEEEYDQVSLIFYAGDPEPTLAGADDDVAYEPFFAVGKNLELTDFNEEGMAYFRNPHTKTDYEINLSEHSYSEFVVGAAPKES